LGFPSLSKSDSRLSFEGSHGFLDRLILQDEQWEQISAHMLGTDRTRGSSGRDNRLFVEALLWIVRTGSLWRDLPEVP
jgi:transposase